MQLVSVDLLSDAMRNCGVNIGHEIMENRCSLFAQRKRDGIKDREWLGSPRRRATGYVGGPITPFAKALEATASSPFEPMQLSIWRKTAETVPVDNRQIAADLGLDSCCIFKKKGRCLAQNQNKLTISSPLSGAARPAVPALGRTSGLLKGWVEVYLVLSASKQKFCF